MRSDCFGELTQLNLNGRRPMPQLKHTMQLHNALSTAKLQNIYKLKNRKIETQRGLLEEKNKEITDSITYAKRIQEAILPPLRNVMESLPNQFCVLQAKRYRSRRFFIGWNASVNGSSLPPPTARVMVYLAPMVSVVCNNALNRSVREFGLTEPALQFLDKTLELVIEQFETSDDEVKDGDGHRTVRAEYDDKGASICRSPEPSLDQACNIE